MPKQHNFSIVNTLKNFDIDIDESYQAPLKHCAQLVNDSRVIKVNDIFCAIIGAQQDGRDHIDQAVKSGAVLVLTECKNQQYHGEATLCRVATKSSLVIQFFQLNYHLCTLCQHYYQQPQSNMTMIGVTGTNGKTSTCQLIAKLLVANQQSCSVLGTLGAGKVDALEPLVNTTPGATELHQYIMSFKQQGDQNVALEVSSHALSQRRLTHAIIDIAVFTNLSRDHLDFHHTMAAYGAAKKTIFSGQPSQIAILNGDDAQAQQWLECWHEKQPVIVYGKTIKLAQFKQYVIATDISHVSRGITFKLVTHLGEQTVTSPLLGDFNIDNLLAAIAVLIAKNIPLLGICQAIAQLTSVIGRMEIFTVQGETTAVVDYAHTPDALENALVACREHCQGSLWLVFGCGGDRDKGKRSLMGRVAERRADHVIVSNDNPRSEAAELIANDILAGCQHPEKITVMLDRQQAVLATLAKAKPEDMVLLAGKGHEDYLMVGNKRIDYNERAVVNAFFHGKDRKDFDLKPDQEANV